MITTNYKKQVIKEENILIVTINITLKETIPLTILSPKFKEFLNSSVNQTRILIHLSKFDVLEGKATFSYPICSSEQQSS